MKQPLVSILMPVKNTAPFLTACLDSIVQQQYTSWELLAVDDGSTDDSWGILQTYAQQHQQIHCIKNTGTGIIEALRTAYASAKGELITRMDSDDIMPLNKLQILVTNLLQHGAEHLATGAVEYFSANELGDGYRRYAAWLNQLSATGRNFQELYKECVIPSPCWMVYRSDLEACQAFRPNRYPEDYDLCFRFYEQGLQCIPCAEVLHLWRDSPNRTSRHDPNYANNSFLELKVHYFLKLNHQNNRPLVLWGAGKKGKYLAQLLTKHQIAFHWICNNDKKIGKHIYGHELLPVKHIKTLQSPQFIIAIAQPDAQSEIKYSFDNQGLKSMQDFFFFC